MITMIYAWIAGVMGMEITLACYGICVLLYFGLCFLFRTNRIGKLRVLCGWLISEVLCDLFWYVCYFENGDYVNRGLAGSLACVLLPILLGLAGLVVTALNESETNEKI